MLTESVLSLLFVFFMLDLMGFAMEPADPVEPEYDPVEPMEVAPALSTLSMEPPCLRWSLPFGLKLTYNEVSSSLVSTVSEGRGVEVAELLDDIDTSFLFISSMLRLFGA